MIEILAPSILLAFVLVGIHSLFGLEVVRRGVIFSDLAVGQWAGLGMALSISFFDNEYKYLLSLIFALFCGLLISFALNRVKNKEAFIGLLYAFGSGAVMIALTHSSEGMEAFRNLISSDILFTMPETIYKSALLYLLIGLILWKVYPKLEGLYKDMLFFVLFAVTVTGSVSLAGVLTVFVFLIAPPFIALSFDKDNLLFAWLAGWFFAVIAIFVSYFLDLPTGYTIVTLGSFFALLSGVLINKKV
ncbi:metal ABC transporter permease [bacterium]|nr:metal ABC transporter permease [bacterium]MBU1958984.1 metal ABC transporter permease [bacterium]